MESAPPPLSRSNRRTSWVLGGFCCSGSGIPNLRTGQDKESQRHNDTLILPNGAESARSLLSPIFMCTAASLTAGSSSRQGRGVPRSVGCGGSVVDRVMALKSGLDQLSDMVLLVSRATTDLERTERIMAVQQEIRQLYQLAKNLEERPPRLAKSWRNSPPPTPPFPWSAGYLLVDSVYGQAPFIHTIPGTADRATD
jgi:hypothetical protein